MPVDWVWSGEKQEQSRMREGDKESVGQRDQEKAQERTKKGRQREARSLNSGVIRRNEGLVRGTPVSWGSLG